MGIESQCTRRLLPRAALLTISGVPLSHDHIEGRPFNFLFDTQLYWDVDCIQQRFLHNGSVSSYITLNQTSVLVVRRIFKICLRPLLVFGRCSDSLVLVQFSTCRLCAVRLTKSLRSSRPSWEKKIKKRAKSAKKLPAHRLCICPFGISWRPLSSRMPPSRAFVLRTRRAIDFFKDSGRTNW